MDLPLHLGMWRLRAADDKGEVEGELRLLREQRWLQGRLRQIAWYALWTAIYLWVSIATINSDLGLPIAGTLIPNPAWLPYLGLVVAVLLMLAIARQIVIILREPDTLLIQPWERSVGAWRGNKQLWKVKSAAFSRSTPAKWSKSAVADRRSCTARLICTCWTAASCHS